MNYFSLSVFDLKNNLRKIHSKRVHKILLFTRPQAADFILVLHNKAICVAKKHVNSSSLNRSFKRHLVSPYRTFSLT